LAPRSAIAEGLGGSVRSRTVWFVVGVALLLPAGYALPASASALNGTDDLSDRDQVVLNGRLIVAAGETVDSAVLFHGSATIAGTVTKSLVVFDGPTDVSGHVQGDVFVFNGDVTVQSGAQIDGDLVTGQAPTVDPAATITGQQQRVSSRFNAGAVGLASRIAWWIGYSISTLVLGLLLLLFAPALDPALVRAARERTGAAIGFGLLLFFVTPIVAVLFVAIVIALPLGLFLLLALALLYTLGYVASAHALGRTVVKAPTSRLVAFLAGWAILRLVGLIPVVGGLVWILASIFGLGLLWVASRRTGTRPATAEPIPPAPALAD
jgi:hypothetical protein